MEIPETSSENGSLYIPPVSSLEEQIKSNAALIKDTRLAMATHPDYSFSLSMEIDSLLRHHRKLITAFAKEKGASLDQAFLALEIDSPSPNYPSIDLDILNDISLTAGNLLKSIKNKSSAKFGLKLKFELPFAASFGFFLVPIVTYKNCKKGKKISTDKTLNFTEITEILEPFKQLLLSSKSPESLKKTLQQLGFKVADNYTKYLKTIKKHKLSVSVYTEEFSFYTGEEFAQKTLSEMHDIEIPPEEEKLEGKIKAISLIKSLGEITFIVGSDSDGDKRTIKASFEDDLYDEIYALFDQDAIATFEHQWSKNVMSGKTTEITCVLKEIREKIPE